MDKEIVEITAVGDIFLGEHPVTLGHGVNSVVKQKSCSFLFEKVEKQLRGGDIICGNLEGIISPKLKNEVGIKSNIFWGEASCANALKSIGFNCLFLANNHNAQHGKDALERTCGLLDKNNIKWTGFNSIDPNSPVPATFNIRGLQVAVLAYCETQQYNCAFPILPLINLKNITQDIKRIKKHSDIIVIALHWGDEFIDYPSPNQIQIARDLIDQGVHLIVGHHSHTMQGIERYKNGLIAYSLGSFVKDLWPKKLRESVILKCKLSRNGVESFSIIPVFINKYWQPEIYAGKSGKKFLKRVESSSKTIEQIEQIHYAEMQIKYMQDVKKLLLKDRLETLFHYLINMPRYNKKMLFENIKMMLKRRIFRKSI